MSRLRTNGSYLIVTDGEPICRQLMWPIYWHHYRLSLVTLIETFLSHIPQEIQRVLSTICLVYYFCF